MKKRASKRASSTVDVALATQSPVLMAAGRRSNGAGSHGKTGRAKNRADRRSARRECQRALTGG